jgi:hypothetical protein
MSRIGATAIMAASLPRSEVVRIWQHLCMDNGHRRSWDGRRTVDRLEFRLC